MSENNRLVHFGIGAFHRGHQAFYLKLLNEQLPEADRWYYTDVNLRDDTRRIPDALKQQQGLYHFKRIAPDGTAQYIEIDSIDRVEDASADPSVIERIFNDSAVKALTITVTEAGYYLTDSDDLNLANLEISHDIKVISQGSGQPQTLYGYLALALLTRQSMASGAITVATCDNLRDNGKRLEKAFGQFIEAAELSDLSNWMSDNVTFPCSMVDRITPVPPANLSQEIKRELGVDDACPIMGENFEQWVIEDKFATDFPPLEKVGVTFTNKVHAFEEAKIRILNGGHFLLSYVGALRGYQTYDENVRDANLNEWLKQYHQNEVIPTIYDRPFDLEEYRAIIISRFSNAYIADSIERIAMDSISKFPQFILPTVKLNLERDYIPTAAMRLIAHWYCFLALNISGRFAFNYKDPYLAVAEGWMEQTDPIDAFLQDPDVWQGLNQRYPFFGESLAIQIKQTLDEYEERYP
ncbi:multiple polyol-specific dehydrogenase [Enterovibrio norvegicus FF-33]|uniref:mannitol dehydrogenase family protein n=1 Tax=Enterovibrio TaxID=188143 RepID=UPI00030E9564|nr:mannitol dehydrogenase family protein [Enterovibrio norvegicus]OEE66595.1 multiple polyol-specific dehydrogenase [Enterovibrio norvegicus FF-33]OEE77618.1 multiple polyol-specific dehydrogenase [Enterovibrio norvegicus FF-162]